MGTWWFSGSKSRKETEHLHQHLKLSRPIRLPLPPPRLRPASDNALSLSPAARGSVPGPSEPSWPLSSVQGGWVDVQAAGGAAVQRQRTGGSDMSGSFCDCFGPSGNSARCQAGAQPGLPGSLMQPRGRGPHSRSQLQLPNGLHLPTWSRGGRATRCSVTGQADPAARGPSCKALASEELRHRSWLDIYFLC